MRCRENALFTKNVGGRREADEDVEDSDRQSFAESDEKRGQVSDLSLMTESVSERERIQTSREVDCCIGNQYRPHRQLGSSKSFFFPTLFLLRQFIRKLLLLDKQCCCGEYGCMRRIQTSVVRSVHVEKSYSCYGIRMPLALEWIHSTPFVFGSLSVNF